MEVVYIKLTVKMLLQRNQKEYSSVSLLRHIKPDFIKVLQSVKLTPLALHFTRSSEGGRFIEGSDFKHREPYVFSAFSNQKFLY